MTAEGETLVRGGGIALWRQLEGRLAAEIDGLAADTRLPGEALLAARFGVNRHTIRQALRALAGRGLLRIEHGRGAFVQDLIAYPLGSSTRFTANLLAAERLAHHELVELHERRADGALAEALRIEVGAPVLATRSLGLADGVPIVVGNASLPLERLPDARRRLSANPSFTALYAAHGHGDYHRGPTRITARAASEDEARLLRMPPARPVLVTESVDLADDGVPLATGPSVWASERVQFVVGT